MKKKPLTQKQTNTDIYAVTREFSPRLANLFLKSLIISCCGNKIHQGFFFTLLALLWLNCIFLFSLNYMTDLDGGTKRKKKNGSFALYLAMLRFESFAFMFKPLPGSSTKTKQKHTHIHTRAHTHHTHKPPENHDITGSIQLHKIFHLLQMPLKIDQCFFF